MTAPNKQIDNVETLGSAHRKITQILISPSVSPPSLENAIFLESFTDQFAQKNPNAVVSTKTIENLAKLIRDLLYGFNINPHNIHQLIVIGPDRVGKSTALDSIAKSYNHIKGPNYMQVFHGESTFWDDLEKRNFEDTRIFAFDGAIPKIKLSENLSIEDYLLKESNKDSILLISAVNSQDYKLIRSKHSLLDRIPCESFFFNPCSISEITEIINTRLKIIGRPHPFRTEVIETLGVLSFGLPGLALWFVREVIELYQHIWPQIFTDPYQIYKIASFFDFGPVIKLLNEVDRFRPIIQELTSSPHASSLLENLNFRHKLNKSWKPVLEEMLVLNSQEGIIKRSDLQERTGIKDSSLTYQCQRLVQEKIVKYEKEGREVNYQIKTPVREALELSFYADFWYS
ncbi:MAG: transcriptional regulator [Candidatus Heimdallarchaeota archaeon]|nr:transcriptional regulator [Candidatus Heimdallarchaeota archaeon]